MHSKVLFLEFIYYHYQNREKKPKLVLELQQHQLTPAA